MRKLLVLSFMALALSPLGLSAQNPVPVDTGEPIPVLSANELDGLVAPIALYPDPLISQILVAATYPDQVVEAYQWLQRNPGLTGPALTQAAQAQNWDPSIQALVVFPDVLARLNQDMSWTTGLGNAFLSQQADVMSAVQRMRFSAQQSGRLYSTPQQQVVNTTYAGQPVVEIVPANPEVIYVPVYDPAWVWGPPVYYRYPRWYYPRHSGLVFNVGISIGGFFGHAGWHGWDGYGWRPAWGSRTVVVNNTFIRQNNFNTHVTNMARVNNYRAPAANNQWRGNPAGWNNQFRGNQAGWNNQFRGNPAGNNQFRGNAPVRENFDSRQNFRSAPAPAPVPTRPPANAFASSRMNGFTPPSPPSRMNTFTPPARTNTFSPPARAQSFAESRMSRPAFTPSYSRPAMPMGHAEQHGGGNGESRGRGKGRR